MAYSGTPWAEHVHTAGRSRLLEPAQWTTVDAPLLANPRNFVDGLYERHRPEHSSAVVAVLGEDERLVASASFRSPPGRSDGWDLRNALLDALRRVMPHDLRRRRPARTANLLLCRDGDLDWSEVDGAWMWALRDASTLHGLRCGAFVTMTGQGWRVHGEARRGRTPYVGSPPSGREDGEAGGTAEPPRGQDVVPLPPGTPRRPAVARRSGDTGSGSAPRPVVARRVAAR